VALRRDRISLSTPMARVRLPLAVRALSSSKAGDPQGKQGGLAGVDLRLGGELAGRDVLLPLREKVARGAGRMRGRAEVRHLPAEG
jgi:hypothetical protein